MNVYSNQKITKYILRVMGGVLLVLGLISSASAKNVKPNILFILTDDQSYSALGAAGNHELETPNIDRLAQQGTQITHTFNQGSWSPAVCAPSRAMINTGRNLYSTGITDGTLKLEKKTSYLLWGETFKQAGYETFLTGKWHVSKEALLRSFDLGTAIHEGGMTYDQYNASMVDLDRKTHKLSEVYPSIKHSSEIIADAAVEYLEKKPDVNDKPFLMYVGFLAPHDTRQSPQNYVDKYPQESIPLPKAFKKQNTVDQGDFWVRDEVLLDIPRKPDEVKQFIGEYYAMINHMDTQVGRILDSLEKSPYAENTIIIFTSDHGLAVGKHGLLGKQNQYDHSIRAPFIIAGKGIDKGQKIKGNIYLNSVFPTTAELAGIEVPKSVQASSFMPLLRKEKDSMNEYIYGSYRHYQRMVRSDNFKLIYYPVIGQTQLFDLKNDPDELHNLSAKPAYRKQLTMLQDELLKLMTELEDPIDLENPVISFENAGYSTDVWRKGV
ncbi:sulfatase-like hydrolase/transferase [uncultured Paraglaciecola sp.]|uniref:sulfatase-like hydrolase/transferase n=1 Tax=uncultured Paraglaciecola sp. TaxID=1765024 RepID=UPI0030D73849